MDVSTVEVYVTSAVFPAQHETHLHLTESESGTFLVWKMYLHCRIDLTVYIALFLFTNKKTKNHLRKSFIWQEQEKDFCFHTKNLYSLDWGYSHKKSEDIHSFHCAWSIFFFRNLSYWQFSDVSGGFRYFQNYVPNLSCQSRSAPLLFWLISGGLQLDFQWT